MVYKRSEVEKVALDYFENDLATNVWLDKYALKDKSGDFIELSPDDTIKRLATELSRIEQKYKNPVSYEIIYEFLKGFEKFVLGGSPLFGVGNDYTLSTLGNCFVVDSPKDSIGGIWKADQELAQIMKRRGGVGIDISTLRPRGSKTNNAALTSTGSISFMEQFSDTTRRIAQEGRRGALMISMDIDHPDIERFIVAKDDLTKITGANISVKITDKFMEEASNDYDPSPENKLWNRLVHQAWKNAEPGLLFWDKIIKESPADCYENFKTITTNPCSELPLCAYDSCRLSAINLYAFVKNPFTKEAYFDLEELKLATRLAQKLMDDLVDLEEEKIIKIRNKISSDPESEDIKAVERYLWYQIHNKLMMGRRTGLGQMGLADAGAAIGFTYGSQEFIDFAEKVNKVIAINSYKESIQLAIERGAFPAWSFNKEKDNPYLKRIYNELEPKFQAAWKYSGRRNIANLTIAPTGSISILSGVSSGIEPVFALVYNRRRKVTVDNPNKKFQDKQGDWWEEYDVFHSKFKTWMNINGTPRLKKVGDFSIGNIKFVDNFEICGIANPTIEKVIQLSPYYDATSHEVSPYAKIKLQSIIQPWIDHSISVTYNLPNEATEEEVSKLYLEAWKHGLKGLTVYRDGSRDGILNTDRVKDEFPQYDGVTRPKDLYCDVYNIMAKGRPWKVFIGILDNKPYEVFAVNGTIEKVAIEHGILRKVRSGRYDLISLAGDTVVEDITHNMTQEEEAFTRIISWALRHGAKLKFGIEQLSKSSGDITSFSKAIARTLKHYVNDGEIRGVNCPNCGTKMTSEGGCMICKQCGGSKCD